MSEVTEMILTLPNKIYISSANVDMRKSIDGLVSIVEDSFFFTHHYPPFAQSQIFLSV